MAFVKKMRFFSYCLIFQIYCLACHAKIGEMDLMDEVMSVLEENYVKEIDKKKVQEDAVRAICSSLDPHSNYLSSSELQTIEAMVQGNYSGIGVEIAKIKDRIVVMDVIPDSPSSQADIRAGDIIIAVDDKKLSGSSMEDVRKSLIGKKGTIVNLKLMRNDLELITKISRGKVQINSSTVKLIDKDEIAYIRVKSFGKDLAEKVRDAYFSLKKDSLKGIILDLRSNPGGLLEEAVDVSNLFLQGGLKIVSERTRNKKFEKTFFSNGEDITGNLPMVVIINAASASASEIVAGALQDNRRAQVLGTQSFGKGSVQQLFTLRNGGAVKLTVALYYTPKGRAIQNTGVSPDIIVEDGMLVSKVDFPENFAEKKLDRSLPDDLFGKNSDIKTLQLYNREVVGDEKGDFQLIRALDVIRTMAYYKSQS